MATRLAASSRSPFRLKELGKDVRVWNEDGMLEKYSFHAYAELMTKPPARREDVDVAIALDTAIQNRLGNRVPGGSLRQNLDQHRSSSKQSGLWRSGSYRSNRAGDRTNCFRTDQGSKTADRSATSPRISTSRFRPIPARSNIQTRPRAHSRSRPSSFVAGSMSAGSASCFTRIIRAAGSSCFGNCFAPCDSMLDGRVRQF